MLCHLMTARKTTMKNDWKLVSVHPDKEGTYQVTRNIHPAYPVAEYSHWDGETWDKEEILSWKELDKTEMKV